MGTPRLLLELDVSYGCAPEPGTVRHRALLGLYSAARWRDRGVSSRASAMASVGRRLTDDQRRSRVDLRRRVCLHSVLTTNLGICGKWLTRDGLCADAARVFQVSANSAFCKRQPRTRSE